MLCSQPSFLVLSLSVLEVTATGDKIKRTATLTRQFLRFSDVLSLTRVLSVLRKCSTNRIPPSDGTELSTFTQVLFNLKYFC